MNYVDEDLSSGSADDLNTVDGHNKHQSVTPTGGGGGRRKRSRKATGDAIVDAMLEIAAASKMRAAAIMKSEDRFSVSKCIKVLDEMQGVDQHIYFLALDLFENPVARETFISLKTEKRLLWLQGKCTGVNDLDVELDEMELIAAAAGYYYYKSITGQLLSNLSPKGSSFMMNMLDGHPDVCREMFRMEKHVFLKLCSTMRDRGLLHDTAGVMIEEQLGIFMNIIGHNERNRVIQERFQHSGETISRHFNNVLKAIKSLSREFLQSPPLATPPEILCSNRLHPYFKDCIGVIDGMHFPAHVPAKDQSRFRNRKGFLSQNVLAACTFDLQFIFVYPGWEGSVADSHILRAVLDDPDQNFPHIPEGKYYLVDLGYVNMEGFIAPYPGVRYHLHEFRGANQIPRNAKELFNHRHASLKNVIQRSFDVLKTRFPILRLAPQYGFYIQRDIVIAACVLHNYIRQEEKNDWLFASVGGVTVEELPDFDDQPDMQLTSTIQEHIASSLRDSIADVMWDDFEQKWDQW